MDDKVLKMISDNQTEIKKSVIEVNSALVQLTENFSEFLIKDSARHEREKVQQKDIDELKAFKSENYYTIKRTKNAFAVIDSVWTKILTSVIIIVLISAGVVTVPSMIKSSQTTEVSK